MGWQRQHEKQGLNSTTCSPSRLQHHSTNKTNIIIIMDEVEQDVTGFIPFYGVAQITGFMAVVLMGIWTGHHLGGFAWQKNPGLVQLASTADDHRNDISIWQWPVNVSHVPERTQTETETLTCWDHGGSFLFDCHSFKSSIRLA